MVHWTWLTMGATPLIWPRTSKMRVKTFGQSHMRSKDSYHTGLLAEFYARMYLRLHGFKIVKSRHITGRHTNRAEIDIIARRGKLLIFVEVKNRPTIKTALDAVSYAQAARLRRAGETYLMQTRWSGDARFDIIAICGLRVHWIKNCI